MILGVRPARTREASEPVCRTPGKARSWFRSSRDHGQATTSLLGTCQPASYKAQPHNLV